jgi:hypothetical protein
MLRFCFCALLLRRSPRGHRVVRDEFGVSSDTRAFVRGHERAVLGVASVLASSLFFSETIVFSIFLFDRAVAVPCKPECASGFNARVYDSSCTTAACCCCTSRSAASGFLTLCCSLSVHACALMRARLPSYACELVLHSTYVPYSFTHITHIHLLLAHFCRLLHVFELTLYTACSPHRFASCCRTF